MKKEVVRFPYVRDSMAAGTFFAGSVLIFTLTSKFFSVFDGFVGLFMDLFSEFGYDLNFFGILVGIIAAFVMGFFFNYLYNLIFWNLLKR